MIKQSRFAGMILVGVVAGSILTGVTGCAKCLRVNPFVDELACAPKVTTPSVETARSIQTTRTEHKRDWDQVVLHSADGAVKHAPLYFEDPFEDQGSQDGKFAWTGEDYFQLFYWRGRYLANLIALPVSLVDTPPWMVMESDGYIHCDACRPEFDAQKSCCKNHHFDVAVER